MEAQSRSEYKRLVAQGAKVELREDLKPAAPVTSGGAQEPKFNPEWESFAWNAWQESGADDIKPIRWWMAALMAQFASPADSRTEGAAVNLNNLNDTAAMAAALDIFEGKRPTSPSPSESAAEKENASMKYEVVADKKFPNDWRVEAIDGSGDIFVTVFSGPDAENLAREYASWKSRANVPAGEAEAREWLQGWVRIDNYRWKRGVDVTDLQGLLVMFASHVSTQKEAALKQAHGELLSLTPGGSEFVNDPRRCAAFAREQLGFLGKIARERNELRVALAAKDKEIEKLTNELKHADTQDQEAFTIMAAKDVRITELETALADAKANIGTFAELKDALQDKTERLEAAESALQRERERALNLLNRIRQLR